MITDSDDSPLFAPFLFSLTGFVIECPILADLAMSMLVQLFSALILWQAFELRFELISSLLSSLAQEFLFAKTLSETAFCRLDVLLCDSVEPSPTSRHLEANEIQHHVCLTPFINSWAHKTRIC